MKVLALATATGACEDYRINYPAEEVAKLGIDITVSHDGGIDVEAIQDSVTGLVEVKEIHTDADILVIQRPVDNSYTSLIKQARRQGIATIVEFDDDLSTVHRDNIAFESMSKQVATGSQWAESASAAADWVSVSTPQLAKYARHGRYSVLRNCVPDSIFETDKFTPAVSTPYIGWTGSVQTHPNDLQQTRGGVARVLSGTDRPFTVVGDGLYVATNLRLDKGTEVFSTGWVPTEDYYQAIASHINIGIVPLELSPFNQAKSALKGLEFASLGVPFVASPTREYERLAAYGIGKIAKSPGDWDRHLRRIIDRSSEAERLAEEARGKIKEQFTYSVTAPQWIEAWEQAIHYRKTHNE